MLKRFLVTAFILLGLFTGTAFAIDLEFDGYIADKANLLSKESLENLNYTIHDLNKKTTAAIALVTLSTLNGEKIEDIANNVMGEYKIGDDTKKNGLVFVTSIGERQLQVILGDGLAQEIDPKKLENIIDKNVLPYFEAGKYEDGILSGTYLMADMIAKINGKEIEHFGNVPDASELKKPFNKNWLWLLLIPIFGAVAAIWILVANKKKHNEQQEQIS